MLELWINNSTVAKKKPVQSGLLDNDCKFTIASKSLVDCSEIKEGGQNHWAVKFAGDNQTWFIYKPHVVVKWNRLITFRHFKACFIYANKDLINVYFEPVNQVLHEFEINTVQRIAAFLAQIAHETCSLRYREEIASGQAYEWRKDLGNIYRGDGRRYKGRGLIQLTGRHNYTWASRSLGIDLVNNPKLAADPLVGARIAGLYWSSRNLNKYADWHNLKGFRVITRKINGGFNGWNDRLSHWKRIKKVLCC